MLYVIGNTGLVGSAICAYFEKEGTEYIGINRVNYKDYVGSRVDCVINANGSGMKGQAGKDPMADFEKNVQSTIDHVFNFKCNQFVHISSVDVYSSPFSLETTNEDCRIDPDRLQIYGFHKYLSELIVMKYCPNWIVLRLGGLVGKNLKKNPIYDMTHGKPLLISKESRLTFIHTETVAEMIHSLINKKVTRQIINVCSSDSIRLNDLSSVANLKVEERLSQDGLPVQNYKINVSKLGQYFNVKTAREYIEKYLKENLHP